MQKKLIALAVAGLVAAPVAMAQSNVTIYGIVDMGFNYSASHSTTGVKSLTGLNSGQQAGSRVGFRGTEDLGNGLKASFVIEQGFTLDTSSVPNTNRQSFLALSGDFGTVAGGLQWAPQHNLTARIDPFGIATAGTMANVYTKDGNLQNTLAYVSPNFNGLNVVVAHSFNATATEVAKDGGNVKVWAVSPRYSNGPINVELNWHRLKSDAAGTTATKVWDLGGTYDFGVVKAHAIYGTRKTNDALDQRQWMVGLSAPVSEAGSFKLSYTRSVDKEPASDVKRNQWAVGYDHKLSARTNIYTAYAKRGQDFVGYKSQFQVGLRHNF